ncbi:Chaperone protein HtpG [Trichinella pseudospiralis]
MNTTSNVGVFSILRYLTTKSSVYQVLLFPSLVYCTVQLAFIFPITESYRIRERMVLPTRESHPNSERNNQNVTYMTQADLRQAYDNILENAVTEWLHRKGILLRNPGESGSGSREMLAPSLQQQQHHQQQQQQRPIIHIPIKYCGMQSPLQDLIGNTSTSTSSLQYQHLQLPEVYETNRETNELLPQSTSSNNGSQSHEYVLPPIERFPYEKVDLGLPSSSSTCKCETTSGIVPIRPETHFVTISPSCSEDKHHAEELVTRSESLSSPAADVQYFVFRDNLATEDSDQSNFQPRFRVTKVDKACQTDNCLDCFTISSDESSSSMSSELIFSSRSPGVDKAEPFKTLSVFKPYQKQNK